MDFNTSILNTNSSNFLEWFLINYFAIDEDLVNDFICDGSNDKGIDGIYADDENEIIYFFQTKFTKKENSTLGDVDLKNFIASIGQFNSIDSLNILRDNVNNDLLSLIKLLDLENKINTYDKKALFITNKPQDNNALSYSKTQSILEVYDMHKLEHNYIGIVDTTPENQLKFNKSEIKYLKSNDFYLLTVSLKQFVIQLESNIKDSSIFNKNVRYSLGKNNKVATEINKTLKDDSKNIILFHNGITMISTTTKDEDNFLEFNNCSIVNGCQSTIAFHNYETIPDNAEILLKIINTSDNNLINLITRNTNNQNPIQIRDLKSNHKFQEQLKKQFEEFEISYEIKRGENSKYSNKIQNDHVAQLICAFHLGKPNISTDKTKLFREYYQEIFSHGITAKYVILIQEIFNNINFDDVDLGDMINHKRINYFLLYVLGELELKEYIKQNINSMNFNQLVIKIKERTKELYNKSLKQNFEYLIKEKNKQNSFDYRNYFRNKNDINALKDELDRDYKKDIAKGNI
jgi:hypothetical protein